MAYRILVGIGKPTSRGRLTIPSPSITDPARIDPRYLDTAADRKAIVAGLDLAADLGNARALSPFRASLLQPIRLSSATEKLAFARRTCGTYHHYVGTCRLGRDREAVVGPDLKVQGIDRLRVADASVIPEITCTNTHVAALIVAERAAQHLSGRA